MNTGLVLSVLPIIRSRADRHESHPDDRAVGQREPVEGVMPESNHRGVAGFLLVSMLLALFFLGATGTAAEPQISADGWRPKRQPVSSTGDAQANTTVVAEHSSSATPQTTPPEVAEPFDWQDGLSDVSASDQLQPAVVISSTAGPAPSLPNQNTACHWCQCQQSDPRLCGHCGLPRPVQAAYREMQPAGEGPRTMLAGDEPTVPMVNRLRLAFEHVNDRVQQTLGQF